MKKLFVQKTVQKLGAALCISLMCTTVGKADGASLQLSLGGGGKSSIVGKYMGPGIGPLYVLATQSLLAKLMRG